MSASQSLGGSSRLGRVLGPPLDKIIKNVAWRKHSHLVAAAKSSLDLLQSLTDTSPPPPSSLFDPLIFALQSNSPKVIEPALDCSFKLFSLGLFCNYEIATVPKNNVGGNKKENEKDGNGNGNVNDSNNVNGDMVFRLIESVCKCATPGEDAIELAMLRCLLAVIRSNCVLVRGDVLVSIVKTCYNVYLGSLSGTNQICAKAVLAQIMIIVFSRVEEDRLDLKEYKIVMVGGLLEFADRGLNEGSSIQFTQNFVNEVMESSEGVPDPKFLGSLVMKSEENGGDKEVSNGEEEEKSGSKIRDDGFVLFKNLCKLSMKFSTQEHSDDQILLRGKVLSLELLKVIMDNGGPIWRTNDRSV